MPVNHATPSSLVISRQDAQRLNALIERARETGDVPTENLDRLAEELKRGQVVEPAEVPADVVTMNSTAYVRVEGSRTQQAWTIVYPEDADLDNDRISILEPLGTALLGYRVGDVLEWQMPAGLRQYTVTRITYQPEAAGDWDR